MQNIRRIILGVLSAGIVCALIFFSYRSMRAIQLPQYRFTDSKSWHSLDRNQFQSVLPSALRQVETSVIQQMDARVLNWMTRDQFEAVHDRLTFQQLKLLDNRHFGWIPLERLQVWDRSQIRQISPSQMAALPSESLRAISGDLSRDQWLTLPSNLVASLGSAPLELLTITEIQALPHDFLGRLAPDQFTLLERFLSREQIMRLPPGQFARLSETAIDKLNAGDVQALAAACLQALPSQTLARVYNDCFLSQILALGPQQFSLLSAERWQSMTGDEQRLLLESGFEPDTAWERT